MSQDINEGDEIRHVLFGDGRVIQIEPLSSIATIDFVLEGKKRMYVSSNMEILSRGQISQAMQEQAKREQEQARKIAQQAYLDRAAIRKKEEDRELERQQAAARVAASEKEFGQRVVRAWEDAWDRMDHPHSFGRTRTIKTLSGDGPKQGWGKRKTPQVLAIQERQHQLFLTVTNTFEEVEYYEADSDYVGHDTFYIEYLGNYRPIVTRISLNFFENYQFPFNGGMVTVIFDKLKEPKKSR